MGSPPQTYILSNNHVLANTNAAQPGDPILQPGPYDGGTDPADRIATLTRFVPITLEPPIPRNLHSNVVDAAIAQGQFHDLDREIYWIGYVRGWRRKANVAVGSIVQKTGRTTSYTTGRITAINATIDVGYGGGRVARFLDQIVTTNISAGGDSGSLVLSLDNVAVGLLFAGSSVATIVNQIENVRSFLRVEVAQKILSPHRSRLESEAAAPDRRRSGASSCAPLVDNGRRCARPSEPPVGEAEVELEPCCVVRKRVQERDCDHVRARLDYVAILTPQVIDEIVDQAGIANSDSHSPR